MDTIRQQIMDKIATRQVIAERLEGHILPSVLHELNMKSRGLDYDLTKSGALSGEIQEQQKKERLGGMVLTL
jgi:hypothetical protein